MKIMNQCIEDTLVSSGVKFRPILLKEKWRIQRAWLDTFASNVKAEKGKWVFRGFMWHGFSYRLERSIEGEKAKQIYLAQQADAYYVFGEAVRWCLSCESAQLPDLSYCRDDVYIVNQNMDWTMVFTHEHHIGPFFAEKSKRYPILE